MTAVVAVVLLVVSVSIGVREASDVSHLRAENRELRAKQSSALASLGGIQRKQEAAADELSRLSQQQRALVDAAKTASQRTPEAAAGKALKSVFTVETDYATGSSFIYGRSSAGALLITNAHVVSELDVGAVVNLHQGKKRWTATITERNVTADLAVLTADVPGDPLEPADPPKQGSTVLALGAPFGLDGTVTTGVLSAVRETTLQFSAEISPGSSGGAVVDLDGHVIGVAQAKAVGDGAEGIGIAIPVRRICGVLRTPCGG